MNAANPIVLLTFFAFLHSVYSKKSLTFHKWENCPEYKDLPITIDYFKIHNYAKNNRTNEKVFTVRKEVGGYLEAVLNVKKCDTSGAPDSCEFFVKDFRAKDICAKMQEKGQAWSNFVASFEPKLECPMKPNTYKSIGEMSDGSERALRFFPVPTGVWKIREEFVNDKKETVLCNDLEFKIIDLRRT